MFTTITGAPRPLPTDRDHCAPCSSANRRRVVEHSHHPQHLMHRHPARRTSSTGPLSRAASVGAKNHPMLGWRYREPYATKSTFISLILEDGADDEIIDSRVTHTSKLGEPSTGTTAPTRRSGRRRAQRLPSAAFVVGAQTRSVQAWYSCSNRRPKTVVEAAGVEPASEDASGQTSTRVGTLFKVSGSPAAAGLRTQQAD
jgi:hypothetical protein